MNRFKTGGLVLFGLALVAATATVMTAASALASNVRTGEYKGATGISQHIQTQLFREGSNFHVSHYLNNDRQLSLLLGEYAQVEGVSHFQNGDPNGINLVLYNLVFAQLADDLVDVCVGETFRLQNEEGEVIAELNEKFLSRLNPVCDWPRIQARKEFRMYAFWRAVMGFEAPLTEFHEWRHFFLTHYRNREPRETVHAMLMAIFLNPHFLLEK